MAKDALSLHLYGIEQDVDAVPSPSDRLGISLENNERIVMVELFMPPLRDELENRAIKKTLTVPNWLNDLAEERKINFSKVLQSALKTNLGIRESQKRKIITKRRHTLKA